MQTNTGKTNQWYMTRLGERLMGSVVQSLLRRNLVLMCCSKMDSVGKYRNILYDVYKLHNVMYYFKYNLML